MAVWEKLKKRNYESMTQGLDPKAVCRYFEAEGAAIGPRQVERHQRM